MTKIIKSTITVILCMIIAITGITPDTACAAKKKVPVKVTFNGKTVTLIEDANKQYDPLDIKALTTKWGEPKEKTEGKKTTYEWEKGESSICYGIRQVIAYKNPQGDYSYESDGDYTDAVKVQDMRVLIYVQDKNVSLFGIKAGMKKDTALKKLKKLTGKNIEKVFGDCYEIPIGKNSSILFHKGKVSNIIYYSSSIIEI